ncbi:LacI family DNA-binding transcriptional regulator [Tsukamurella tyrosinosolvens]|uniref:LacI family DNA-binding transcriptional regulator n=1 Tax=Tsukamurella tyrosinosolvens TaxID=57704 RepID=UPI00083851E2|nr:LacI family DNA-binding transcriptional regulator [Tsukamurella tyrosinosolvens]MCA4996968.1 LacI family DNA-binding transcriptional regulator [Tsukamurella tyrosinosolvens]MEC4616080.1 LacI family DNA-binding transcriptional regulator [Tsukamurella tyrosinosolvens]WEL94283.1 LacI family DNA-binding transcriptional regulator [Tsukamurella tyrosinosolvens]
MTRGSNRITLVHVAEAAGVSLSTASHAFGVDKPISDATRARVLAAAADLGYEGPDPRARSLRSGRTDIIGVQVDDEAGRAFRDPVIIGILDGVSAALSASPTSVLLLPDSLPEERLRTLPVDGVVAAGCSPALGSLRAAMAKRSIPVVTAGNQVDDIGSVGVENRSATALLTGHLRALGHRSIGVVRLRHGDVEQARTAAALAAFPDAVVVISTDSTIDEGFRAGGELLDANAPTAVIAQSDLLAAGVIRAAEARGLRVPEDLSVVGFDGVRIDGFDRVLTTIRQPIVEMGRRAAQAVLAAQEGAPLPTLALDVELVVGDTTGPAPQRS